MQQLTPTRLASRIAKFGKYTQRFHPKDNYTFRERERGDNRLPEQVFIAADKGQWKSGGNYIVCLNGAIMNNPQRLKMSKKERLNNRRLNETHPR